MSLLYGAGKEKTRRTLCNSPEAQNSLSPAQETARRDAADSFRRRLFITLTLLLVLATQGAGAAFAAQSSAGSRIVTAAGVRLRERPDTDAAEVARLQLGAVVDVQERSAEKSKAGASEDYWYLVSGPGGARGWVFGGLTAPFAAARRDEIYLKLANERLSNTAATFADLSELVRFLGRATREVTARGSLAELELLRLEALARSLASFSIQDQDKPPYKSWTAEHEREIVYSEPAGQWYVRAELFWDLQRKYAGLPVAERAAWQAAQTPLPGECEGYLPCHLALQTMTNGQYLKLYPRGPHADAALAGIAELLRQVSEDLRGRNPVYDVPREDRAEFRKTVATLRAQIAAASSPKKAQMLKQLDAIARRFS
jgi:hypothetical protein